MRARARTHALAALTAVGIALATAPGCASILGIHDGTRSEGKLGQPCDANSGSSGNSGSGQPVTCVAGLFCQPSTLPNSGSDGTCVKQCQSDTECATGERCAPVNGGFGVGTNVCSSGVACNAPGPCGGGNCQCSNTSVCASDHQCRIPCDVGVAPPGACLGGQHCISDPAARTGNPGTPGVCVGDPGHDPNAGDGGGGGDSSSTANPIVVADNAIGAAGVAVDGVDFYWTSPTTNSVQRCPLSGCVGTNGTAGTRVQIDSSATPSLIALGATYVYWGHDTMGGMVSRCSRGGTCTSGAPFTTQTYDHPYVVATRGPNVAWRTNAGDVMTCNESCATPKTVATGQAARGALAMDDSFVYWVDRGMVQRCGITSNCTGGANPLPTPLNGSQGAGDIAADQTGVYFAASGGVFACAGGNCVNSGPNAQPLVPTAGNASAIAVDGQSVYWLDLTRGAIARCAVSGCNGTPSTIVSGLSLSNVSRLTVDLTEVYFTAGDKVLKIAK